MTDCDTCKKPCEPGLETWARRHVGCAPTPRLTHPTVERYTLVTVEAPGGNIEAGLHRELGEPIAVLREELRRLVQLALGDVVGSVFAICDDTAPRIVDALEAHIQRTWPHRPWWCEVYDEHERLTQTYAPYGMPRHQATPRVSGG